MVLNTNKHTRILQEFENYQNSLFDREGPRTLYDPVRYLLEQPGKKLRPLLCLITAEGLSGAFDKALPTAAALEVFHNFTLMHDDIMDEAPVRRGLATVHMQYNIAQAILSGDVMLIWAYRLLSGLDLEDTDKLYLIDRFSHVATGICEGQQRDMDFETRSVVSRDEYIQMIEQKTAILLGASLELGALSVGFDRQRAAELFDFGRLLGLSFQIQDDWLDAFGDPALTGKKPGGDILRKKKTIVYLEGMHLLNESVRNDVRELFDRKEPISEDEARWVIDEFLGVGVDKLVEVQIYQKMDEALRHLEVASLPDPLVMELKGFADQLVKRTY